MLIGYKENYSIFSYLGEITPRIVWDFYNMVIERVKLIEILKLSKECIDLFSRFKINSIKLRFEHISNEESKTREDLLDPNYDFDVSKSTNSLMIQLSEHTLNCKVIEDLARVSSLRHELDAFIYLTIIF